MGAGLGAAGSAGAGLGAGGGTRPGSSGTSSSPPAGAQAFGGERAVSASSTGSASASSSSARTGALRFFSGGGLGGGASGQTAVSAALKKALESDAGKFRWVAAVSGSQSAASLELATGGEPVMAIGGFNNEGGNLTLAEFKRYVAAGDIHYYLASSGMRDGTAAASSTALHGSKTAKPAGSTGGAPGAAAGASSTSSITSWVEAHFKSVKIGGLTVYDLTQARS
jgi:hypothetical protein